MKEIASVKSLSSADVNLVERFESAYNSIDRQLRTILNTNHDVGFLQIVKEGHRQGKLGKTDEDYLRTFAILRNAIVHGKERPGAYLAVPAPFVVEQIEKIRDRILRPEPAIPKFQKAVESIATDDSLARVLSLINARDYSQFPVYRAERFAGLLTENGITRWLAHHVTNDLSLVELEEVSVRQVLGEEEKRTNFKFVPRTTSVYDIVVLFADHEFLEAVLITNNGKRDEKPLGLVTRWDIVQLKRD